MQNEETKQTEETLPALIEEQEAGGLEVKQMTIDELIKVEQSRFTTTPAMIKAFKKKFGSLTINGIDDKAGYEAVKNALAIVRPARTQIGKDKAEIKSRYTQVGKALDAKQKELETMISAIEDPLQAAKDAIDDEKERIKNEAIIAAQKLERERVVELIKYCVFDGVFYSIGDNLSIAASDLGTISPELYGQFISRVREEHDAQQLAEHQKAENARIQSEKDEAARIKFEQEKADLQAEKDKMKDVILRARRRVLLSAGFYENVYNFYLPEKQFPGHSGQPSGVVVFQMSVESVSTLSEDIFYDSLDEAEKTRTIQYDNRMKAVVFQSHVSAIEELGLTFNYTSASWRYTCPSGSVSILKSDLESFTEEECAARLDELESSLGELESLELARIEKINQKAQEEANERAAEAIAQANERRALALANLPEAEQIAAYINAINSITRPEITGVLCDHFDEMQHSITSALFTMNGLLKRVENAAAPTEAGNGEKTGSALQPEGTAGAN